MARLQVHVRRNVDPESPLDGIRVERVARGPIDIISGSFEAWDDDEIRTVDDKHVLRPRDARWLRDVLSSMDLED